MKIQVGNNIYEVDDNFERLSPEEQDSTIKEIQAGEQLHTEAKNKITKNEITKNETFAQNFGRSAASMADSALNGVTGALDWAAYPLARASGLSPEEAQRQTTSPKDIVGRYLGVRGTPGYENAPLRQLGNAIGQGMNENVIKPIAQATGLSEQDVGNMVGSATMLAGPAVPKVGGVLATGAKGAANTVGNVGAGALGRAIGSIAEPGAVPKGYQTASSRIPVGDTYIPKPGLDALRQNPNMTVEQLAQMHPELGPQPVSNLPRLPMAMTGGNVPAAGQGARAFGEQLGETYRNPWSAALDIGSALGTGVPVVSAGKALMGAGRAMANSTLAKQGFSPLTAEQTGALARGQNPFGNQPPSNMPPQPKGPVAPGGAAPTNPPPTTPPGGGAGPVQPTSNITPPTNAINSGFSQQLANASRGPVNPNTMNMMEQTPASPWQNAMYKGDLGEYRYSLGGHPNSKEGHIHGSEMSPLTSEQAQKIKFNHAMAGTTEPVSTIVREGDNTVWHTSYPNRRSYDPMREVSIVKPNGQMLEVKQYGDKDFATKVYDERGNMINATRSDIADSENFANQHGFEWPEQMK